MRRAREAPIRTIAKNAGVDGSIVLQTAREEIGFVPGVADAEAELARCLTERGEHEEAAALLAGAVAVADGREIRSATSGTSAEESFFGFSADR